ncbi:MULTISPECIES: Rv3654c family TadE-like protein [unclassified Actinopolyspora]|uniref:Rv3654c family TadE-like protein n=1 Tax=unclassified Actinopolyspora TaxID=2639451 RepID=UPI0013F63600|nr:MULTISPECIES: Rv3654c family TadE-like protein [unclassified Actinopolyspora]NHD19167.1 flp pilus-assembly TadE/G-like family protein [Actinopolyspora sp. BKK2]NHE78291.1 flp pilus-assembly TadE/G-like family protein [Actinopolyspora sp. BKK1]
MSGGWIDRRVALRGACAVLGRRTGIHRRVGQSSTEDRDGSGESRAGERGVSTVVGAVLIVALLTLFWVGIQFGATLVAGHRVRGAADLAALAAASHAFRGEQAACDRAEWVVRGMDATLLSCEAGGTRFRVRTEAVRENGLPGLRRVTGRALAGPVHGERHHNDHSSR